MEHAQLLCEMTHAWGGRVNSNYIFKTEEK